MKKWIATIAAGLAFFVGQAQSNIQGTWTLNQRTSISGPDYANGVPSEITVLIAGNQLIIDRTAPGQSGSETSADTVSNDGKQVAAITTRGRHKTTQVEWTSDKTGFTVKADLGAPGDADATKIQIHTSEVWAVSADGKTLTITKTFENLTDANDKWSMKGTYDKK